MRPSTRSVVRVPGDTLSITIALAAVAAAWSVPTASADIGVQVDIAGGVIDTGYGTGCTYSVVANGRDPSSMSFYDNGIRFAVTPGGKTTRVAQWTPTRVPTRRPPRTRRWQQSAVR